MFITVQVIFRGVYFIHCLFLAIQRRTSVGKVSRYRSLPTLPHSVFGHILWVVLRTYALLYITYCSHFVRSYEPDVSRDMHV